MPEPILPDDANVTVLSPIEHIHLRVDPDDPEHAAALKLAFDAALSNVEKAMQCCLRARHLLLDAGYRASHPVCKDIDDNLVRPLAFRLEYVRHGRRAELGDTWPAPLVRNQ